MQHMDKNLLFVSGLLVFLISIFIFVTSGQAVSAPVLDDETLMARALLLRLELQD